MTKQRLPPHLSPEQMRERLSYDPDTGVITHIRRAGWCMPGSVAGYRCKNTGYIKIELDHRSYLAHRLALWMTSGEWPNSVDHKNRNRADNRLENLLPCSHRRNLWNTAKEGNGRSGIKGVREKRPGRWEAYVCVDEKFVALGTFSSKEEAAVARTKAVAWMQETIK